LNDKVNLRTDCYGGTDENRARFTLEVLDAVISAIGATRTAVRFSPFGTVLIPLNSDPISLFRYVLTEVEKRGIAYVCLTQPRTDLMLSEKVKWEVLHKASKNGQLEATPGEIHLRHFEDVLKRTPKLATGGYNGTNCFEEVEKEELDAITFARFFISNPDLVERIKLGVELTPVNGKTIYADGPEGYVDYPCAQ
jgi:N-ethylmaleimide reductase